jgi:hypothetical protein
LRIAVVAGEDDPFVFDDAEGFENDEHNNLIVTSESIAVVFAEGRWERVEIGNDDTGQAEI